MKRKRPAWSMYDSHAACNYPWQALSFTTSSGSWVEAPSTTPSHNDSFDDHGFEATQGLTPKVCTARYYFAIAGSGVCPPPACRIQTVRAVIWMCSPVQINLCVHLLRSSVEIKLLRLSAEISPWDDLLYSRVEIIRWDYPLRSTVENIYCIESRIVAASWRSAQLKPAAFWIL